VIKQIIPKDYCLGCQGCCRFSQQDSPWQPVLLDEEILELSERNIPPALISREKKIRSRPYPQGDNFICSFFEPEDHKCKIYAFRPFECRLYPFLINRKAKKVFLAVDLRCPFVQENSAGKKFKAYIQYLTGFFNRPRSIGILRHNSQLIQAYSGVLNLAELKL